MSSARTLAAALSVASLLAPARAPAQGPPAELPALPPSDPDSKSLAQEHFERGKTFYRTGALPTALAEFLASRKIYPTRNATNNAALCLVGLQRFDEALDLYEALLAEFEDLPESMKVAARTEVVRLRGLVGTLDVVDAELGAAITIDDRSRGDYPLARPLRVPSGTHVVRVFKEGFEPFEARVDVAGGESARVSARLRALVQLGRLRVTEKDSMALDIVVDGSVVGKTPWEGPLAPGDHTVLLRGTFSEGTQPVSVPVRLGETTPLTLTAENLEGALRVEPTPAGASVAIDSVTVGRGVWEGRLRVGKHRIEVLAEGFLAAREEVVLDGEERSTVRVALDRDLSSPMWKKPSRITLEVGLGVPLTPTFGGGVAGQCREGCSLSPGFGAHAVFHGGYELGSGFGLGATAGYVNVRQEVSGRDTVLRPVGLDPYSGVAADTLSLRGFLVGAWAGYGFGERWPVRFRLGGGALIGSVADERTFVGSDLVQHSPNGLVRATTFVYVAPEVRVGVRLGKHVELSAGLAVLVLVNPSAPVWAREDVPVDAKQQGLAYYEDAEMAGSVIMLITPGLGARYDF